MNLWDDKIRSNRGTTQIAAKAATLQYSNKYLAMVTEPAGSSYAAVRLQKTCSGMRLLSELTPARTSRRLSEVVDRSHSAVIAFNRN